MGAAWRWGSSWRRTCPGAVAASVAFPACRPVWAAPGSAPASPPWQPTRCTRPAPWSPPGRRKGCGAGAWSSILAQSGPQPKGDRDGRAQAENDTTDRGAGQPTARVEDVVAQLITALLHGLTQRTVEFVERGGGVLLTAAQRDLGGGPVIANRDVGVDPIVGPPPLGQQLIGALQVALVDGVASREIFVKLLVHGVDAFVEGLLADFFVPAPDQRQCLVGTGLLSTNGQVRHGFQRFRRSVFGAAAAAGGNRKSGSHPDHHNENRKSASDNT